MDWWRGLSWEDDHVFLWGRRKGILDSGSSCPHFPLRTMGFTYSAIGHSLLFWELPQLKMVASIATSFPREAFQHQESVEFFHRSSKDHMENSSSVFTPQFQRKALGNYDSLTANGNWGTHQQPIRFRDSWQTGLKKKWPLLISGLWWACFLVAIA